MSDQRPDPDLLLGKIREEEMRAARGKLKIFFGASAGVGKTYAMLSAARQRAQQGHPQPQDGDLAEGQRIDDGVDLEIMALVAAGGEHDRRPKVRQLGEMLGPILDLLIEDWA